MKNRCPGCRRLMPARYLLCDLCNALIPDDERRLLHAFFSTADCPQDSDAVDHWIDGIIDALIMTRMAERRLALCNRGPVNRVFPHVF